MDIRDYKQGHVTKRVRVCMRVRASLKCDFVLLKLLTLVASRNTTQALIGCLTHPVACVAGGISCVSAFVLVAKP